jgi:molybdate transport system ATP-binding protein
MAELRFDCRFRRSSGFELDVRFEMGEGVTALLGPSGSGKTTTLDLIAGLLQPDAGSIRLGDQVLADRKAGVFLPPEQRGIGYVFQDHLLFPHLTIRDNLLFGHGRRSSRAMVFDHVVKMLEIADLLARFPSTLSGGQRQRVALGRALLRGPELLLMDEPLASLDKALTDRILIYLERALHEWRIPVLLVSHDLAHARRMASQVVAIESGKVVSTSSNELEVPHGS